MRKGSIALVALVLAFGAWGSARAIDYSYTTITYPGAGGATWVNGISNEGAIVGNYLDASGAEHGFSLSNGAYASLNYPGSPLTYPLGINSPGVIVGDYYVPNTKNYMAFSLSNGIYATLYPPGASFAHNRNTIADGVNDAGTIAGTYMDASGAEHAFFLSNGVYATLPSGAFPYSINNAGTIAGFYAGPGVTAARMFSLSEGSLSILNYPGALWSYADGINDSGTIIGVYGTGDSIEYSFVLDDGTYSTLKYPGALQTVVTGINNDGAIVGTYYEATGDPGDLLAYGFFATPVPLPSAVLLFGPALLALAKVRRRFRP